MSIRRRIPRPLALELGELQSRLAPKTVLGEVQSNWEQLVGAIVAVEAKPVAERAGVLTISCSSSVWAAELAGDSQLIVERLNGALSNGKIVRLRCVVSGA